MVNVRHDTVELFVHLFKGPGEPQGVLAHLQAGGGYTARIGRLGGSEQHAVELEDFHRLGSGGHIGALRHGVTAVFHQGLGGHAVQLVLCGAGKGNVAGDVPDTRASLHIFGGGNIVQIGLDAGALDFLDLLDDLEVDAVFIHDIAVGVAHGDDLAAQLRGLLVGVDGHIAAAGDHDPLAVEGFAVGREHLLGKIA